MYKQLTVTDFRKILKLPDDYKVDGVLVHGAMRKKKHKQELEDIIDKLGYKAKYDVIYESGFYENITVIEINGRKIWFDSSYGGAYLCEIIHLACLLGSKKNILVGSCAGLSKDGKAGDIVLPTSSFGNESTTRMYQPDNEEFIYFPDKDLLQSLRNRINKNYKVIEGKMMTCQAAMMESWDDIVRWSDEGYVGIEMESSTMLAVSNYFKVPSAAVLFIADNLIKKQTLFGDDSEKLKERLKESKLETFKVAFEELLS
jgi:purine-nucleoside phosphorylase